MWKRGKQFGDYGQNQSEKNPLNVTENLILLL